jgi:iron complex transport system permease protein
MGGNSYYISPTVFDDYVAVGALNGRLYVMEKENGNIIDDKEVYAERFVSSDPSVLRGSVTSPIVIRMDDGTYRLMFSVSDGRGMNAINGGIAVYGFDGTELEKVHLEMNTFGLVSNYVQRVVNDDFQGIYFMGKRGLFRMNVDGGYELLNNSMYDIKSPPLLVNGDTLLLVSYERDRPLYQVSLDGKILSLYTPTSVRNFSMSPAVIVEGMIFYGNDSGAVGMLGMFPEYIEPGSSNSFLDSPLFLLLLMILIIVGIIAGIYAVMRWRGIEKPFSFIRGKMTHYVDGEDLLHNTRSKHRLMIMIVTGAVITFAVAVICLCVGYKSILPVGEMFSSLFSAISKGGSSLSYNELVVYESRLPRTLMALIVGIGLSIAGCMYQAIIRNPLVDPYIMGVSAGAGTAAIAVIGFNFTLFGLFSPHSIYLTAVCAIIGGIAAFFATMILAEKSGGSSINYVLAGVVIGLALSSIQSVMLSMAGHQVANALQWLFGSFSNVTWNHIRLIAFPVLALSFVPLFWAREFNLVLLGEDQARQMGLNVRKFSRSMLIIASALTALCVAFVGIIGFVGLVIPHVCRMILGGDHRLVLPASIAIGGALMMIADLAARTIYLGQELPVGAITTMIGVPVFAYLLIKRGKLYEG